MPHRQTRARTIAELGELRVEIDSSRPTGRLLRQAGMDASYIDLADATHLEFDYLRWLRVVLRVARARRVLHIGGGACALPRALAAEDSTARHEVCEVDADVLELARRHLGLRRGQGLRVRHTEGRAHLARQPPGSWDAIVIDAFVGARVPAELTGPAAMAAAARAAPLALVNVVEDRSGRDVQRAAAAMATAYPHVWTLGRAPGNTIVAGSAGLQMPDLESIAAGAAADPSPAQLSRER